VRNVFGAPRIHVGGIQLAQGDPLLRWTRIAMFPVVVVGSLLAIRVSQTGILLTLAFDIMLACLAAPFLIGVFWRRPGVSAAVGAIAAGLVVRLTFLVLTPTLYGVPNDILYLPNEVFTTGFDGWATLVAAVVGFGTYVILGALRPRTSTQLELADAEFASVSEEATVPEPVPTSA